MAYNQGRPTTAELYAVPTAPQPSAKAQCPPWSKQYVASPERRKKRRQPPRRGRGRGRGSYIQTDRHAVKKNEVWVKKVLSEFSRKALRRLLVDNR